MYVVDYVVDKCVVIYNDPDKHGQWIQESTSCQNEKKGRMCVEQAIE